MKVPKDFEIKKRMARVAKPVLEVLLSNMETQKRESIFRKIVGKSGEASKLFLDLLAEGYKKMGIERPQGYHNRITGNLCFTRDSGNYCYPHEMIHKLKKYFLNDYNTANAMSAYLLTTGYIRELVANPDKLANPPFKMDSLSQELLKEIDSMLKPERIQEATLKESLVAQSEYKSGHYKKGFALGLRAAAMDVKTKIPGAGLFYLRLVNLGLPIEAAETLVLSKSISGMDKFAEKYGVRWNKILEEDRQIFDRMIEDYRGKIR